MLYESNAINFDLIIHDIMNEERRLLAIKEGDVVMFIHRNDKNKQSVKGGFDDFDFINREIYVFYKAADRKFKHLFVKC